MTLKLIIVSLLFLTHATGSVWAQPRGPSEGWSGIADGLAVFQGSSDLSGAGSFTSQRTFLRGGGLYRFESGQSVGLLVSTGNISYDFGNPGNEPWNDVKDLRISLPLRFSINDRVNAFVAPSVRYDYQSGASASDGRSYGAFAGITWRLNDRLTIGPGAGVFSQIEDDDLEVFPALLIDWDISDRWNFSTGSGLGATQGPGLTLTYDHTDDWSFSLSARSEEIRFRLDDRGLAPNGVGQDSSFPVVVSVQYKPTPFLSLTAFAGAEFDGELQLDDSSGATVDKQSYDTAPIAGIAFRLFF
ncbi:MAG: hypothetical protein ABJI96_22785 [Paracoccaceae bacterium]